MVIHPRIKSHFVETIIGLEVLEPEEILLTKNFESLRINSFCSGRYCAHKCLEEFEVYSTPILINANGSPQWPEGFVGSISHSQNYAGAVVARKENFKSIGLDIEEVNRIQPDIWHLLFTSDEQSFLSIHSEREQQLLATIFFSIKEAFYKYSSSLTEEFIDFLDVKVTKVNDTYFIQMLNKISSFSESGLVLKANVIIKDKTIVSCICL
jgi:phosphopantetheine--protein transferase-like protein